LSEGQYVSKQKYEDDLSTRVKEIETLNESLNTRNTDLEDLQKRLAEAGTADAEKLTALSNDLESYKNKYETETKKYKEQLKKQAYEYAVRDFANSKNFSSKAAKRDFIQSMIAKDLKMEDSRIIGAEDFASMYSSENADAFINDEYFDDYDNEPALDDKPKFISPTPGAEQPPVDSNDFLNAFHFMGVRGMPDSE
jgi:vacuolar-type H+-ATPase subunit I/STV1